MTNPALLTHLATGTTHLCHCWSIQRRDGTILGFTDHDRALIFDEINFMPETGLSAKAISNTTGLSVDNTEAVGVLSSDAITELDINAGRYDGAEVTIWRVQWDDLDARQITFAGEIGEITRASGGFQAELRGLSDALNQPQGRSYLKTCSAILGDKSCGVDLDDPAFTAQTVVDAPTDGQSFQFGDLSVFNAGWFDGGVLEILSGQAQSLRSVIRVDQSVASDRHITLWEPIRTPILQGDEVRLIAGCNRLPDTCREKFENFINFQGFPEIPGDDWLVSVPRADGTHFGQSRLR